MKSVKPSVDILEGLTTGFSMDVSASFGSQMVHWPCSPSLMLCKMYAVLLRITPSHAVEIYGETYKF